MTDRTELVTLVRFQVMLISPIFNLLLTKELRRFLENAFSKNMLVPLPLWNLRNTW